MYKLASIKNKNKQIDFVLLFTPDGATKSIPFDPANTDYQAYLKWLEEGNTPEPADQQGAE